MCDSFVLVRPGQPVWIGKNSDREPSEAQLVERRPAAAHAPGTTLTIGEYTLEQAPQTHAVVLSRPTWMWGCEMGVNQHGLAVANEAVFTRLPVAERGLTSMDLQRLALERCASADDALELIIELLARFPQGGRMGYRGRLRYHGSFLLADPGGAWVLETAGALWAAARVRGRRAISNALTIDDDFDRIHPQALAEARRRGFCRRGADFGFARCFADPALSFAAGAALRREQTRHRMLCAGEQVTTADLARVLRDHAGGQPASGLRMQMTCAHASWQPTRWAGQTTGSMIARLSAGGTPRVWMTGTSSPCSSVFKPVPFDVAVDADSTDADSRDREAWTEALDAPEHADQSSLWWAHERLHRTMLADWSTRAPVGAAARQALEAESFSHEVQALDDAACLALWRRHRAQIHDWRAQAEALGRSGRGPFERYWGWLSARDGL